MQPWCSPAATAINFIALAYQWKGPLEPSFSDGETAADIPYVIWLKTQALASMHIHEGAESLGKALGQHVACWLVDLFVVLESIPAGMCMQDTESGRDQDHHGRCCALGGGRRGRRNPW